MPYDILPPNPFVAAGYTPTEVRDWLIAKGWAETYEGADQLWRHYSYNNGDQRYTWTEAISYEMFRLLMLLKSD